MIRFLYNINIMITINYIVFLFRQKVICKICGEGVFRVHRSRHEQRCQKRKEREEAELKPYQDVLLAVPENQNGIYTCKECRLQYNTEFDLIAHECCHFCQLDINVWKCGLCSKIKKIPLTDMKQHIKVYESVLYFANSLSYVFPST